MKILNELMGFFTGICVGALFLHVADLYNVKQMQIEAVTLGYAHWDFEANFEWNDPCSPTMEELLALEELKDE